MEHEIFVSSDNPDDSIFLASLQDDYAMRFIQKSTGKPVPSRFVLRALAAGALKMHFDEEIVMIGDIPRVKSHAYRLAPTAIAPPSSLL